MALAGRMLAGGEDGRAALKEAIAASGLGIIDAEGNSIADPSEPAQGLSFRAYEVEALAGLEEIGFAQPATHLADVVAAPFVELDGAPVASMLLEDVRDAAADESPTRRFWAHFVIELGRQGRHSYDMLAEIGAPEVLLGGTQIGFILRRLQGDLLSGPPATSFISTARYVPVVAQLGGRCEFDDLDFSDPRAGDELFGRIITQLVERGAPGAAQIPRWKGAAGMIEAYAELLFSLADHFFIWPELAGPDPFERTPTTTYGDIQELTATAEFTLVNDLDLASCISAAIQLMTGSPAGTANARITGAEMSISVDPEATISLADLTTPGSFGFGPLVNTITDNGGVATVSVVGKPQDQDLPGDAQRVVYSSNVDFDLIARGEDVWRDVIPESVANPSFPNGLRAIPPAVLRNAEVRVQSTFSFQVADWELCPGGTRNVDGLLALGGVMVAQGFCPGGDLVGTITWEHHDVYDDPALNNSHHDTHNTVVINLRFNEIDGEWVDAGSSFSFTGNEVFTSDAGDCFSSHRAAEWSRSGPFAGDEHVSIDVWVDAEAREVYPDILVSADMRGHSVTRQMEYVGDGIEQECVTREEDYDQGREEWPQIPACGPALEPLVGRISDDGRTVDFSCSASETSEVNTGTSTETWSASGTLTFAAPR